MTQLTVSQHWRTVVSQPHQGPIHQAQLTEREREVCKQKNIIYIAPWRSKTQRCLEDRELNQARSKPDTVDRPVRTAHTFVIVHNTVIKRQYFFQYSPSSRPASGHTVRGMSEREPAVNQGPHQIQNKARIKSVGSCPCVHVSWSCASGSSRVSDPRSIPGGLRRKVGSACEEFEDNEGGTIGSTFLRVLVPTHVSFH